MPNIKIRQLDERVATSGLHLGGGAERRKLEPGEVLDLSEDVLMKDGRSLFDGLWDTGKIEMTPDDATRPLDYLNAREARLCSPSFKGKGPEDAENVEKARAAVAARLLALDSADEKPPVKREKSPGTSKETTAAPAENPRTRRRAAAQAAQHGTQDTP